MTFTNSNPRLDRAPLLGELPEFVKHVPAAEGSTLAAVHYWLPERTGDPEIDYQRGRQHFGEAVAFSYRPNAGMFLAYVLVAMFQNIGPMENGFIDALLEKAIVGAAPPRLTAEEIAAMDSEGESELLALETMVADAIKIKGWLPSVLRLHLVRLLSGCEGEFIGGAITMMARLALNGSRN